MSVLVCPGITYVTSTCEDEIIIGFSSVCQVCHTFLHPFLGAQSRQTRCSWLRLFCLVLYLWNIQLCLILLNTHFLSHGPPLFIWSFVCYSFIVITMKSLISGFLLSKYHIKKKKWLVAVYQMVKWYINFFLSKWGVLGQNKLHILQVSIFIFFQHFHIYVIHNALWDCRSFPHLSH